MQLVYGAYSFPVNGVAVTSTTVPTLDMSSRTIRSTRSVHCHGWLTGDSQTELSAMENLLRLALLIPYQTLSLVQDNGAASSTTLTSSNTISGVYLVDGPHFPEAMNSEYVTTRTFDFTMQAEQFVNGTQSNLLSWQESLSLIGTGGPLRTWRNAVNAPPQRQVVYPSTTCRATQAGSAVGHMVYPVVPPPIFPAFELFPERSIQPGSPRRLGAGLVEYPISWRYSFEAGAQLVGLPNLPPI